MANLFGKLGLKALLSAMNVREGVRRFAERRSGLPERMATLRQELFAADRYGVSEPTKGLLALLTFQALQSGELSFEEEDGLLDQIKDRAWIGYRDIGLLISTMENERPLSLPQGLRFLREIERQKAEWLFLPIVYAIARRRGDPVPDELYVERLHEGYRSKQAGKMLATFVIGNGKAEKRLRGTMLVAMFLLPEMPGKAALEQYLAAIRDELRTRYHTKTLTPQEAMKRTKNPEVAVQAGLCADQLSKVAGGALWVEALFVIERDLYGKEPPQLDHLIEKRFVG